MKDSPVRRLSMREQLLRLLALGVILLAAQQCFRHQPLCSLFEFENGPLKQLDDVHQLDSILIRGISSEAPVLALANLTDLRSSRFASSAQSSATAVYWEDAIRQRREVIDILEHAGIKINLELLGQLPKWEEVTQLYGDKPVILGMERCQEFRRLYNSRNRSVGKVDSFWCYIGVIFIQ